MRETFLLCGVLQFRELISPVHYLIVRMPAGENVLPLQLSVNEHGSENNRDFACGFMCFGEWKYVF